MSERGFAYDDGYTRGYRDGYAKGTEQIGLVLSLPWSGEGEIKLCGPFPITPEGWDTLMCVLAIVRDSLVRETASDPKAEGSRPDPSAVEASA